jgi:hypothetical protein
MRSPALFLGALVGTFLAAYGYTTACRLEALSAENRELRLRDAARARVQRFHKGEVSVDAEAIEHAAYNLGTPPAVLEAMRRQENGSPLWEFGHRGKTEWVALGVPPQEWQAHEAARTANKAVWRFVLKDPKLRAEAIKALGIAYTSEAHAKSWARNVNKLMGTE